MHRLLESCCQVQIVIAFLSIIIQFSMGNDDSSLNASHISAISSNQNCMTLNQAMLDQSEACRCFDGSSYIVTSDPMLHTDSDTELDRPLIDDSTASSWIGCSKEKMPAIYKALTSLPNETNLTQLWIWDSFMPLIPAKIFGKVRPVKLIIERCRTGDFGNKEVFKTLGDRLIELELKNNILRDISAELLAPLRRLVKLDLSVNQLTQITTTTFGKSLPSLLKLSIYQNQLTQITDGALDNLQQLKWLNLANNRLERITAATFAKLTNLEYLNLENNRITEIDENAFARLTRLRVLILGGNQLKTINFPSKMPRLRQLFLNDNNFQNLDDIRMSNRDESNSPTMAGLETLHLDENGLKTLATNNANGGLKRWPSLRVLSLASNNLTTLKANDFDGLSNLQILSLQGNNLTILNDGPFSKLNKLRELFLSKNHLMELGEAALEGLTELTTLTVAHNQLENVHQNTFDGLNRLKKLFLNDNNLKYLGNTIFDTIQSTLSIIDLSDNTWHCNCQLYWLMKWVSDRETTILIDSAHTKCHPQEHDSKSLTEAASALASICLSSQGYPGGIGKAGSEWEQDSGLITSSNNVWITVLGVVLGVVSIFILLAVSYLYFQEVAKGNGRWRIGDTKPAAGLGGVPSSGVFGRWSASGVVLRSEHGLRRVPSDMVNLIPKSHYSNSISSTVSTVAEKM